MKNPHKMLRDSKSKKVSNDMQKRLKKAERLERKFFNKLFKRIEKSNTPTIVIN